MGHLDLWRSRKNISIGKGNRRCVLSDNRTGLIRKYGLNIDRQSFRENHVNLGWQKLK